MRTLGILPVLVLWAATSAVAGDDLSARIAASREAVKAFAGALKGELSAAMGAGGPVAAIEVCNLAAPAIAEAASDAHGWTVGRTSLKLRNPANAPDAWELAVLREFEDRKARGEDPKMLEHAAIVTDSGVQAFRYMKAIPTQAICTKCHGTQLDPNVIARLKSLYPNDQARGFSVGDIRGAFTIVQPME